MVRYGYTCFFVLASCLTYPPILRIETVSSYETSANFIGKHSVTSEKIVFFIGGQWNERNEGKEKIQEGNAEW
jgi:hypothetical protein